MCRGPKKESTRGYQYSSKETTEDYWWVGDSSVAVLVLLRLIRHTDWNAVHAVPSRIQFYVCSGPGHTHPLGLSHACLIIGFSDLQNYVSCRCLKILCAVFLRCSNGDTVHLMGTSFQWSIKDLWKSTELNRWTDLLSFWHFNCVPSTMNLTVSRFKLSFQ